VASGASSSRPNVFLLAAGPIPAARTTARSPRYSACCDRAIPTGRSRWRCRGSFAERATGDPTGPHAWPRDATAALIATAQLLAVALALAKPPRACPPHPLIGDGRLRCCRCRPHWCFRWMGVLRSSAFPRWRTLYVSRGGAARAARGFRRAGYRLGGRFSRPWRRGGAPCWRSPDSGAMRGPGALSRDELVTSCATEPVPSAS